MQAYPTMKVTDHIQQAAGKTLFSFEILPPSRTEYSIHFDL